MSDTKKLILCPYCGSTQSEPEDRCAACGGFFDPLSLKVTQQHMGPWFIRDRHHPFRPGCSYEVLAREVEKGKVKPTTIVRGPTTRQFWSVARNVAGLSHLLGYCHACGAHVEPDAGRCEACGEVFYAPSQRDQLGLAPAGADVRAVPTLSDSGTFQAIGSTGASAQGQPHPGAAPTGERGSGKPSGATGGYEAAPVVGGSPALAGLRDEPAPVRAATAQTSAERNAMAWMTSGTDDPDTLATATSRTAPLQRTGWTSLWTWMLIIVNVVVFAAAIAAVLIVVDQIMDDEPTDNQPPATASADEGFGGAAGMPDRTPTGLGRSEPAAPEPRPTPPAAADPPPPEPPTATGPEPASATAQPATAATGVDPAAGSASSAPNTGAAPAPGSAQPATAASETQSGPDDNIFNLGSEDDGETSGGSWQQRYQRAISLEQAQQLDKAMAILKQIAADAPAAEQPGDLEQVIERVQDKLNRKQLEEFFGEP